MFQSDLLTQIRERFAYVDADPQYGKRIFFDNSGGSLRLKEAIKSKEIIDLLPDCPERSHARALDFQHIIDAGKHDILHTVFGAQSGTIMAELTASQAMFTIIGSILENIPGTNAVTTNIEHPSAYDAVAYHCNRLDKQFRVAPADEHGFIDPKTVNQLIDQKTVLLCVIASSNISGNIMDLAAIIHQARSINPNIFIVVDAVQHMPHGTLDVTDLQIDAATFAPYKFFGCRGIGFAYLSERMALLPHPKLLATPADKWSLGTPTPSLFASFSSVIDYVCWLGIQTGHPNQTRRSQYLQGMHAIEQQERYLLQRLLEGSSSIPGLRHIPGVSVYADYPDLQRRDLIVAMGIHRMDFETTRKAYEQAGVVVYERVRSSFYSKRIIEALGLDGAIRVSPLHCHTADDIDAFLHITTQLARHQ